ncbi:MAG: AbrB/MazE/SpoVT family DNA-binding domain-containing protein [Bdellovibrionales bacterium]
MRNIIESKMTTKGQVTIPKVIREKLGVEPGAFLSFHENENGDVFLKKMERYDGFDFEGILPKPRVKNVSLDDIQRAIEDGWAGKIDTSS